MILRLTYEEITALNSAAERLRAAGGGGVAAPPEALASLEERLPLRGDISVRTLDDHGRLLRAVDGVLVHLRQRMDALILEQYVGADDAVNAYFDYANILTARARLAQLGHRMAVVADLTSGGAAGDDGAGSPG